MLILAKAIFRKTVMVQTNNRLFECAEIVKILKDRRYSVRQEFLRFSKYAPAQLGKKENNHPYQSYLPFSTRFPRPV